MSEISEADRKMAEEIWRVARQQPGGQAEIDYIAAALAQARREGRRAGIEALRDNLLSDDDDAIVRGWIRGSASRLLEAEK